MKLMDAIERSTSEQPTAVRRFGQGWCKVIVRDTDLFQLEVNEPKKQKHHLVVDKYQLAAALIRLRLDPRLSWEPVHGETVDDRL